MANQIPEPDRTQRSAMPNASGPGRIEETTGMPRWVKVFGVIAVLLVVLVVVMLLGGHGPSRHG